MSPSPLAHSAMGYFIFRWFRVSKPDWLKNSKYPNLYFFLIVVGLSLLPDVDVIPGLILGDFRGWHNQWTHSLIVGFGVALVIGAIGWWKDRNFGFWFLVSLISYQMHIIMDLFTYGDRGSMIWWPLTSERFVGAITIFIGVRWSEGVFSITHLFTLFSELVFAYIIVASANLVEKLRKTLRPRGQSKPFKTVE
jgi:membrane-bound metal-dependent hydrolase YbcI (DUF457 family)